MQRFYETFGADADPTGKYALILMDEIDAHMHPRWQQILVDRLRKHFPKVQFLSTTHSPLIVSNVDASNVSLVSRDPDTKKISVKDFHELNLEGIDYERLLVGPLFNLPDSRALSTQEKEREYLALVQIDRPTAQQIARRKHLAASLLEKPRRSTVAPLEEAAGHVAPGSVSSNSACFMISQLLRQYVLSRISGLLVSEFSGQNHETVLLIAKNLSVRICISQEQTITFWNR